jgi:hypothetical protein
MPSIAAAAGTALSSTGPLLFAKRQDYSRKRDRAEEDRVEHDQEDEQSAGRGLRA